jgi:hypothetical protein
MATMHFRNGAVGWASVAAGVGVGLVMGLWSFDGPMPVPAWLGEYGDTSRRLARLGHIAFIGLGILDILADRELRQTTLGPRATTAASWLLIAGNTLLPITLFAAAAWRPLKYLMPLPAMAVFAALVLLALGSGGASPHAQPGAIDTAGRRIANGDPAPSGSTRRWIS